jgi:hypothetical protein
VLEAALLTVPALHVCGWETRFQKGGPDKNAINGAQAGSGHSWHQMPSSLQLFLAIYTCSHPCIHPSTHAHRDTIVIVLACWQLNTLAHLLFQRTNLSFVWFCFYLVVQEEKASQVQERQELGELGFEEKRWRMWWSSSSEFLVRAFAAPLMSVRWCSCELFHLLMYSCWVSGNVIALFLFLSPV